MKLKYTKLLLSVCACAYIHRYVYMYNLRVFAIRPKLPTPKIHMLKPWPLV